MNGLKFKEALDEDKLKDKKYIMVYYDSQTEKEKEIDISYQHLDEDTRRIIDYTQLNIVLIDVDTTKSKERILYKIFANLNIGGIPLSPQELRNGIYCCPFYDMLQEINQSNSKWRLMYGGKQGKGGE